MDHQIRDHDVNSLEPSRNVYNKYVYIKLQRSQYAHNSMIEIVPELLVI